MPEDSNQPPQAAVPEKPSSNSVDSKEESVTTKKQRRGLISRIWNGIFRVGGDDYEKRLQHISKEEDSVRARMKRRSQSKKARNLIILSFILEVFAIGYAIMTTRSLALDWKMRALRVLPMFVLPVLSSASYSILVSFTRMYQQKDQKTLDRLRAERQAKIDELKERSNYYRTQQLIERYDPDPAAKAAAATILASKLGADSGLKVYLGDESKLNPSSGKSNDVEFIQSKGMRNRKQSHARSSSTGCVIMQESAEEVTQGAGYDSAETLAQNQTVVEHHPNSTTHDGGWIARIAALLVGEDPAQSYALICGNCHMHNGLARKEDFAYITYYCPHCHALNRSREHASVSSSSNVSCPATPSSVDGINNVSSIILKDSNLMTDSKLSTSNLATPLEAAMGASETEVAEGPEIAEGPEN